MAEWWDWSGAAADRDEAMRQSKAAQALAALERDYDAEVQAVRDAMERPGRRGGTPFDPPLPRYYRSLPPETRMAHMWEAGALTPKNPAPGYGKFLGEVVRYPFEIGSRPRDTILRSKQEMAQGNYGAALGYAASAPLAVFAPAFAAGREGDSDDWRAGARELGVPESHILAIDIGTDPATYVGLGAVRAVPRLASRADDIIRSLRQYGSQMRYGQGVPTYLEDAAGNVIMRSRNSPGGILGPLMLPAQ
jgi:hypothetical protein